MTTGAEPMRNEMIESYLVSNGKLMLVSGSEALPEPASGTLYEVIRVISGVPLFLERHLDRLEASARLVGSTVGPISGEIGNSIRELIKANGSPDKNIKIIVYNLNKSTPDYMVYFIHSSYPTAEDYRKGIHTILLKEERSNPNAKIVNTGYKDRVASALSEAGAYEALLVNRENEVTEGSRSNVFFVKSGVVYTAPKGSVLIGITRVCIFELCKKLGIEIVEKPISASALTEMDGAFMTGTSPKLLPISSIDDMHFNSPDDPVIKALMKGYDDMLEEYIASRT